MIGSTELVRTLIAHDLVDEFRLMIDSVVVGGGKRIFRDDGALRSLRLVASQVATLCGWSSCIPANSGARSSSSRTRV